jgi:energy-converting hydrogenase B subunit D
MVFVIISIVLGLAMIFFAIAAVYGKKLTTAIIATGAVSLFASLMFLILAAPDVAMTEAAIGSGLSTVIFFFVLNKIRKNNAEK